MKLTHFHTGQWNLPAFTLDQLCISAAVYFFFYTGQWKLHTFTLGNENYTLLQWSMKITHFYNGQWKLHTFTLLNENYTLSHWTMIITCTLLQWSMKINCFYTGQWKLHTFTLLNDNYMHTFTMVNEGPRFDTVSVLLSLQKLWVVDTVLWLCLSQLMKHWNDSHRCPILMQVILVVTV